MTDMPSLDPNPFLKPIYSEKGDYDSPSIARIKGYALSQWEHAEQTLCTMFSILVRPTGGTLVSDRAFGSLFSSGGRRELVLGAAEAYFALLTHQAPEDIERKAEELLAKLKRHIRLFGEAAHRRDEIAHGVIMGMAMDRGGKFLYFLVPALYASKKYEAGISPPPFIRSTYRMNFADLDHMSKLFDALGSRTAEINREISNFYQSLPETLRARHP